MLALDQSLSRHPRANPVYDNLAYRLNSYPRILEQLEKTDMNQCHIAALIVTQGATEYYVYCNPSDGETGDMSPEKLNQVRCSFL